MEQARGGTAANALNICRREVHIRLLFGRTPCRHSWSETLLSLKEFVGREIGVSDWLRMTQDRIGQFAEATEDRQWIHVDPERAQRESPYG